MSTWPCVVCGDLPPCTTSSWPAFYCAAHALFRSSAKENDPLLRVKQVQKEVDEVKDVMHSNIEKVIERGEKLDVLQDKVGTNAAAA